MTRRRITPASLRALVLAWPEVTEQDHHGFPSFRVKGKIFATLPDDEHLHVLLDGDDVARAVAAEPDSREELWWGKTLSGVRVTLPGVADVAALNGLLAAAWRRRAPASLQARFDAEGGDG